MLLVADFFVQFPLESINPNFMLLLQIELNHRITLEAKNSKETIVL